MNQKMNTIKLNGIDGSVFKTLKKGLLERGVDLTKHYSVPEAVALYSLVTKCCVSGIVDYANSLNLPEGTVLSLQDIARMAFNQNGSDVFCQAAGLHHLIGKGKNVYGRIEIPNGKNGERESDDDGGFCDTLIHQLNGHGKVTNFEVSNQFKLDIQVDSNTDLELKNIETGGDINIYIRTAALVCAGADESGDIKEKDAIRTTMSNRVLISISTCAKAYFGVCAGIIEINQISTCRFFKLHAIKFDKIIFQQSTCDHTYIYVPENTTFKLTNKVEDCRVDCDVSLIDENSSREIEIKQVSTGIVHIKSEKIIFEKCR